MERLALLEALGASLAEQQALYRQLIIHFLAKPVRNLRFRRDMDAGLPMFGRQTQDVPAGTCVSPVAKLLPDVVV